MEDKSKKEFVLLCEGDSKKLKCELFRKDEIEKCKTYKETGVGPNGSILNVKRVCEIKNFRDIIKIW